MTPSVALNDVVYNPPEVTDTNVVVRELH